MAEAPITGLTASVKIGAYPAGLLIGYISGFKLDLDRKIIEILAFGTADTLKIPSTKNWTGSIDGTAAFATTESQAQLVDAYNNGTALTIGTYLNTTTYFEGSAYVKSLSFDAAPDDKVNISAEFEGSGAIVFSLPGGTDMLTFVCTDHATAGATQVATVSPVVGAGESLMYRVNVGLPYVGQILTAPWTAYTAADALPAINGDIITLAKVTTATGAVLKRGQATAVVT